MIEHSMLAASAAIADEGCFQDSDTNTPLQRSSCSKT
jgi:hypothetical protein